MTDENKLKAFFLTKTITIPAEAEMIVKERIDYLRSFGIDISKIEMLCHPQMKEDNSLTIRCMVMSDTQGTFPPYFTMDCAFQDMDAAETKLTIQKYFSRNGVLNFASASEIGDISEMHTFNSKYKRYATAANDTLNENMTRCTDTGQRTIQTGVSS